MEPYQIFTDTACDIAPALLAKWRVACVDMTFHYDGEATCINSFNNYSITDR